MLPCLRAAASGLQVLTIAAGRDCLIKWSPALSEALLRFTSLHTLEIRTFWTGNSGELVGQFPATLRQLRLLVDHEDDREPVRPDSAYAVLVNALRDPAYLPDLKKLEFRCTTERVFATEEHILRRQLPLDSCCDVTELQSVCDVRGISLRTDLWVHGELGLVDATADA